MQTAAPPPQHTLHWIPVSPSWLVAVGLVILAALPHQLPAPVRQALRTPWGAGLFLAIAVSVGWWGRRPILAMAMAILVVGVWTRRSSTAERFVAPVLNKDPVTRPKRWFVEEVMAEEPAFIQDRTEGPALNVDEVHPAAPRWTVERDLDEHPIAIQERPVPELPEYDETNTPYHS